MLKDLKTERVGILLVHGIGDQKRFEHLDEVVRNIALFLQSEARQENSPITSVQVIVNVTNDAAYAATQQTWTEKGASTALIEVIEGSAKQSTILEFTEVWWSDLDESYSFKTFLNFWVWGLSLWSKPPYDNSCVGTAYQDMRLPGRKTSGAKKGLLPDRDQNLQWLHSLYLFLVSSVILLLLPFLWIVGRSLRSILGIDIKPEILVEYLGDVKLYQQDFREGKKKLVDLGKIPPRVSIRRRMMSALVEMSLKNYDRWYILAHSLGTVLALNGLMETEQALPNYLPRELWERWKSQHSGAIMGKSSLSEADKAKMLPPRPSWLENSDVIDRKILFKNLQGLMTYGAPLSKFAVLWPSIVSLNKDEDIVGNHFEWINVFDPTDPVSDFTRFYDALTPQSSLTPREVPYKAEQLHLLSHGQYLNFNPNRKSPLIKQVTGWIMSGERFSEPLEPSQRKFRDRLGWPIAKVGKKDSPIVSFYFVVSILVWLLVGTVICFVLSWIMPWAIEQIIQVFAAPLELDPKCSIAVQILNILSFPPLYALSTIVIVFVVGTISSLFGLNRNKLKCVEDSLTFSRRD